MRTLAGRYSLQDRVFDGPGWSYWRGQDGILNRAVGVLILAAGDPRERALIEAARNSAAADDPRVQRVLDVLEDADNTCLIVEWLAGATSLEETLAEGPLTDAESRRVVLELARTLASRGAVQLSVGHGALAPRWVICTDTGRVRLLGIAVAPVLAGHHTADSVGLGQLLYACLTGRWPGTPGDSALPAAPQQGGYPVRPRMIRAGLPAALDDITARALGLPGRGAPLLTAGDLAAALELITDARPSADPPIADPARTGRRRRLAAVAVVLSLVASAGVVTAMSLNSSQPAKSPGTNRTPEPGSSSSTTPTTSSSPTGQAPLAILSVADFDPPPAGNGNENSDQVALAHDGNAATAWTTLSYTRPDCGGLKPGVGLVVDLGLITQISAVRLNLVGRGTNVEIRASSALPVRADDAIAVARTEAAGEFVTLPIDPPVRARYLVIWLTRLPASTSGYRGGISEIQIFHS